MKIGFIGLGIMGKPMSKNLIKAGDSLTVYNRHQRVADELVALGAAKARNAAMVAKCSDVVITMLPNSPQVKEVTFGQHGIAEGAHPGLTLIDMSSIDPTASREIGGQLEKMGIGMLDAPVSGGEPKAVDGTISVMVGGKKELFDQYYDLLKAMAGSVIYVGNLGSGNVAKLANQIIVALNIAAVSEAFVFAQKMGVSPDLVFKAIRGGLAGSTVMDAKAPMMMDRTFAPGFRIELHVKDLNNALNAAHAVDSPVPLTAFVREILTSLQSDQMEKEDHSSIVKYYEKLANTTLHR